MASGADEVGATVTGAGADQGGALTQAEPAGFPPAAELERFVMNDVVIQATHRMSFTKVDARRTNGHVQGIAAHFDKEGPVAVYASVSDFPPGWGACLVEGTEEPGALEAIAFPQGRHPGGINVCDGILAVPIEHDDRYGRVYLYDLGDPLYPSQIGYFCQATFRKAKAVDPPSTIDRPDWPTESGGNAQKASAAGIARMGPSWAAPQAEAGETWDDYLVVVLHENRYLRFLPFSYNEDRTALMPTVDPAPLTIDVLADDVRVEGWPEGSGTVVDNISLLNTADGLRLVVMSAEQLWRGTNLQRKQWLSPQLSRWSLRFPPKTRDCITVYDVGFEQDGEEWKPTLTKPVPGEMTWVDDTGRRRPFESCWPGFRWGSSVTWDPNQQKFVLLAAEFFGDEITAPAKDPTPPAIDSDFDGDLQFLQFAGTENPKLASFKETEKAILPSPPSRLWRPFRDLIPAIGALAAHEWRKLRLPPDELQEPRRPVGPEHLWFLLPALALCVGSLLASVAVNGLTWSLALAALGSLAGFISIALIAVAVNQAVRSQRRRLVWSGIAGASAALGALVTSVAFLMELPWLVAVAGAATILCLAGVYELWVRPTLSSQAGELPYARSLLVHALALSVAGAASVVWFATGLFDGLVRVGFVLAAILASLVGLAVVKYLAPVVIRGSGKVMWFDWQRKRPSQASVFGTLSAILAVAALAVGWWRGWYPLAVAGFWLLFVLGSIWGAVEYLRTTVDRTLSSWRLLVAAPLILIAGYAFWVGIDDAVVAVMLTVTAVLIGALFVFPGEAGALLVALVFVGSWVAIDTDSAVDQGRPRIADGAVADGGGDRWVVALGDSFISGEGAPLFFEGTNSPGSNECHRAPTAWPDVFADHYANLLATDQGGPVRVVSFACSGATIEHVRDEAQHPGASTAGGAHPQLDLFETWLSELPDGDSVDYVLVSAGGNDAGFSKVIAACVMPSAECGDDVMLAFGQRAQSVGGDLRALLGDIATTLADSGPPAEGRVPAIVVNPYIDPVGPGDGSRCSAGGLGSLLSEAELGPLRRFRATLNGTIEDAVSGYNPPAGVEVMFNAEGALVQGNLCGDESGPLERRQNWIVLQPPDGGLAALNPATWVLGSLHPTPAGHNATASAVCRLVEDRHLTAGQASVCPVAGIELADGGEIASLPDDPNRVVAGICGDAEITACTDDWVGDRLADAALVLGLAGLLAVLGGALGASYTSRVRERDDSIAAAVGSR